MISYTTTHRSNRRLHSETIGNFKLEEQAAGSVYRYHLTHRVTGEVEFFNDVNAARVAANNHNRAIVCAPFRRVDIRCSF